ncbi:MAG: PAS domain S-box protein [Planctomycetes bacterium]|nr:PAS domain S-box protein [Planctomycetota bacterium]
MAGSSAERGPERRDVSFGTRLVAGSLLLVLVSVAVVGTFADRMSQESLREARLGALRDTAALDVERLGTFLEGLEAEVRLSQGFFNLKTNLPIVARHGDDPSHPEYVAAKKMLDAQLSAFRRTPGFIDITLADSHGRMVYVLDEARERERLGDVVTGATRVAFDASKEDFHIEDQLLEESTGARREILLGAPVHGFEGEFLGVVLVHVDVLHLIGFFREAPGQGETGERVIGKRAGDEILIFRPERVGDETDWATSVPAESDLALPMQEALAGRTGAGPSVDHRGEPVLAAWRPVPRLDWGLVVKIDAREAYAPAGWLRLRILVVTGTVLAVLVLASIGLARTLTRPVREIARVADRIRGGDLVQRVEVRANDEVGTLARCFNEMADALIESNRWLEARAGELASSNEELRRVQAQMSALGEALDRTAIVSETDIAGKITYVNDKFVEISGYSREELLGQDHRIINSAYHPKSFFKELWATIGHGKVWRSEIKNRKKTGEIYWVDSAIAPILAEGGKPVRYISVRFDITDRRKADEQFRTLNRELEFRVSQLAAVNRELEAFSHSVSHDLRAPIRSIDGFSQALLEDFGERLEDGAKGYLLRVRAASQRMGELIDDMLTLSRVTRQEMRRERVDLSGLARSIGEELRRAHPARNVELVVEDGLVSRGDSHLLRVVLENLLGNAWKFTSRKERARVEFGRNGEGEFFVRDDGAGFDMAYAGKLFGPFQRLHTSGEFPGTGIGLATVQRIALRHGGRVRAEGKPDEGATIYFSLGAHAGESGDGGRAAGDGAPGRRTTGDERRSPRTPNPEPRRPEEEER